MRPLGSLYEMAQTRCTRQRRLQISPATLPYPCSLLRCSTLRPGWMLSAEQKEDEILCSHVLNTRSRNLMSILYLLSNCYHKVGLLLMIIFRPARPCLPCERRRSRRRSQWLSTYHSYGPNHYVLNMYFHESLKLRILSLPNHILDFEVSDRAPSAPSLCQIPPGRDASQAGVSKVR